MKRNMQFGLRSPDCRLGGATNKESCQSRVLLALSDASTCAEAGKDAHLLFFSCLTYELLSLFSGLLGIELRLGFYLHWSHFNSLQATCNL